MIQKKNISINIYYDYSSFNSKFDFFIEELLLIGSVSDSCDLYKVRSTEVLNRACDWPAAVLSLSVDDRKCASILRVSITTHTPARAALSFDAQLV